VSQQLTAPRSTPPPATSSPTHLWPWLAAGALAVLALAGTRLAGLTRSLWWDEAFTAQRYVRGGAEVIFDPAQYYANNHVLYSLLSSWTADLLWLGDAVIRLWAVGPALAGAGITLVWAWRRVSPAVAVTATVLLLISPLAARLQTEARGYGLVLLVAAVLLAVTSSGATRTPRWRDDLAVSAAGAVGMLTFPPVLTLYLAHTGVWFVRRPGHRVRLTVLTAATGLGTFLVLRPLVGPMLDNASSVGSRTADPITWWSPIIGPATVLGGPSYDPALPGGEGVAVAVTLALVVLGLVALLTGVGATPPAATPDGDAPAPDPTAPAAGHLDVGLQLVAGLGVSIALLGLVGFSLLDRYVAFTLPALVVAAAAGLVALVRLVTRGRPLVTSAVALVALVVVGAASAGAVVTETTEPRQNFGDAAYEIAAGDPAAVVVRRLHVGYAWYLDRLEVDVVRTDDGEAATEAFCDGPRPAVYVPDPDREPEDGPACLGEAERRSVPHRGGEMVWYELP
jgi:hypothetical protein